MTDYAEFFGRHLKGIKWRSGGEGSAKCPFHEDRKASLSVNRESGLWFCHACNHGGTARVFAERRGVEAPADSKRAAEAVFDYRDEKGVLLFQVVRFAGKQFRQRRPDGKDGWLWKLDGVRRVPYRLPELLASTGNVFVVEGEKDVEILRAQGLTATCNPGGAGKWRDEYGACLQDRICILLSDNDDAGREHIEDVARKLKPFASHVLKVELPGLPPKGDVSDWLAQGHTAGELLDLVDAAATNGDTGNGRAGVAGAAAEDWPEPEEIGGELLPVPSLKEALIPEALRPWVLDMAERFQCPPDYFAAAAMVEAGQLLGRRIAIRPKQYDNWHEHANLWGGIVAPPGFMKSPAIREAFHPLFRLERAARTEHDDAKRAAEVGREIAESNRIIIRNRLRGKELSDSERERLARQLSDITFEEPTCRRYIVNDVTVEKVGELLNQNPEGLGLLCDELSGWMGQMEQPEYANARAFYLSAWSGKTPYTYDRIGRGSIFIGAACLSVFGALVPGTLERYLRAAFSGERADGFIQRFQLLVYPDLPAKWEYVDRPIDQTIRARAFHALERLGALTADDFHAVKVEEEPPFVRFTPAAQSIWIGAHEWCMKLARSNDEHPVLRSHFSKYPKLLAALALVAHALRLAEGHTADAVEQGAIDLGWAWAQYLEQHARRIYQIALSPGETAARLLAEKLRQERLPNPFTVREVQQKHWAGLGGKGDVLAGLEVLEECSWVRPAPPAPGKPGRPSSRFWVNPKVGK